MVPPTSRPVCPQSPGWRDRIAVLGLSLALAAAASLLLSPNPALAAYYGGCLGSDNNFHAYVYHSGVTSGIRDMTGGTANLRAPHACTAGASYKTTFVFPISSQDGSCEQLGWGSNTGGTLRWYYTKYDNNGCVVYSATTIFPTLTTGHGYAFRVYLSSNGVCGLGTQWAYTIRDTTTGASGTQCGTFSALPTTMWAGFEASDNNDQLGGAGVQQFVSSIGWSTTVGGSYNYIRQNGYTTCCGSQMPYWVEGDTHDPDGNSKMWAYTTDH